jgi:Leucine-rich repeat (LRR) protein
MEASTMKCLCNLLLSASIATSVQGEQKVSYTRIGENLASFPSDIPLNVTGIHLQYNALTGISKADFQNLMDLKYVNLRSNKISNIDIDSFENNLKLDYLLLDHNPLKTILLFNGLQNQLGWLDMPWCSVTDTSWDLVIRYTNLRGMRLHDNALNKFPDLNQTANALVLLDLSGCGITFIPSGYFDSFSKLQDLKLEKNEIMELHAATFHGTKLIDLYLSINNLHEIEDGTLNISTLQTLELRHNQLTNIPMLKTSGSDLSFLDISDNKLNGTLKATNFTGLTNLKTLLLENNQLTGIDEAILSIMPPLEVLNLTSNNITKFKDPFQWYDGPITHLTIDLQNNPMICDSDLCWAKNNSKVTVKMDGCFGKPWTAVSTAEICASMFSFNN